MGLLNAVNRFFERSIFARAPVNFEEIRRRKLFTLFTLVILFPLVAFGTMHMRNEAYLYGIMIYLVVLILITFLAVVRFLEYGKAVYRAASLPLLLLLSYWTFTGTIGGYGSLWLLVAPPFAFFLLGKKEASFWTVILGLFAATVFINPFHVMPSFRYSADFAIRHLSIYGTLVLLTYYYESVREKYMTAMEAEQAQLIGEKELLAVAKKEVDEVNLLLNEEMAVRKRAEVELKRHRDNLEKIVDDRTAEIQKKHLELELSEKRYKLLADNLNDMIWSTDLNLAFTYISPSVSRVFGYGVEEAMVLPFDRWNTSESFRKVALIYAEQMKLESEGAADPDRHVTAQLEHYKKDGTVLDVEVTVSFMRDENRKAIGIVGITRDISDRIREQGEKEIIQQQLAQAQKMEAIGTLVAGIAHDFNNFLGGIMGSFDLLGRILKKEKLENRDAVENYLQIGVDGSRRSADLIKQLLAISRKHEIILAPIDVNVSIRHIQELCRNSFPKSIELDFREGSGPLMIMGDMVQIDQVLLNICINASHAMTTMRPAGAKQGGILGVTAEKIRSDDIPDDYNPDAAGAAGSWIRVRISDNGVGMGDDIKKRIFEPFFSTNKKKGSGLGLSTSYSIIQKHDGRISVYSEPGRGSCFSIYFPAYDTCRDRSVDRGADGDIVRGTGTVLIIDDEDSIISIVKGFLEQCGYTVLSGHGVEEGIGIFRRRHGEISTVLIDFSMPEKSGLEVFQELKSIDPGISAILASGMIDPETKSQALGLGIRDTISKPFLARELSIKIKELSG